MIETNLKKESILGKILVDKIFSNNKKLIIMMKNEKVLSKFNLLIKNIKANDVKKIDNNIIKVEKNSLVINMDKLSKEDNFTLGSRWKFYLEEIDSGRKYEFLKADREVKPANYRHLQPIEIGNKEVIPYVSGKNEINILVGGFDIYMREVYKARKKMLNIEKVSVEGNNIKFVIKDYIDIDSKVIFRIKDRKSRDSWGIKIDDIHNVSIDMSEFILNKGAIKSRWDCFLEVYSDNYVEIYKIGYFDKEVLESYKRFFNSIETDTPNLVTPYLTTKNELAIVIKPKLALQSEKLKINTLLRKFNMSRGILYGTVDIGLDYNCEFTCEEILLKYRSSSENIKYTIPISKKTGCGYSFKIDLNKYNFQQFYWDIYVVVKVDGQNYYSKIKKIEPNIAKKINKRVIRYSYLLDKKYLVYPYVTLDGALAIAYREQGKYETNLYKVKENIAYYTYKILRPYFEGKDIWLSYEKFSEAAQDNAFYFFRYMYNEHANKKTYYIIQKDSPDYVNLKGMEDRVLDFMSFKYMIYMYASNLLVSSESKSHCYAWRVQKGKIKNSIDKKKHVFLQHGVTALKRVDYVFKKTTSNAVDLFVATSDYESKIIEDYFGYKKDEIITTGFCRWDVLEDKSTDQKQILLMPTWRNWMDGVSDEKFMQSEYYKKYAGLLNSEKLNNILKKTNTIINFYIHPKFKQYLDMFTNKSEYIKIYQFGELKVNDLLMKSSMAITDYSSIAWDMYYQKKPVLFYQFDIDDYNFYQGSYLDMEKELFGDRSFTVDQLVKDIEYYINNKFVEKKKYAELRKKYFKYVDKNNCKRTYEAICSKRDILLKDSNQSNIIKFKQSDFVRRIRNVLKNKK